ncbi:MAG: hypothetical protein CMJ88_11260 [Planctomycetes bacterium]|nr:hypothetical protein [Planctomycetota bacterium]
MSDASSDASSDADPQRDLSDPDQAFQAVSEASLRLMAGAVSKPRLAQLKIAAQQEEAEYPWQRITQAIVSEPVEGQGLVKQGLVAQRDWILRGGRVAKGPSVASRAKGFFARLTAQLIFGVIFTVVVVLLLLLLKYRFGWNIYWLLDTTLELIGAPPR